MSSLTFAYARQLFEGHGGPLNSLLAKGPELYSGSADGTARRWDRESGKCTGTYTGHADVVTQVHVGEGMGTRRTS